MHKILIAEDHEMTAEIMQLHLSKYCFEIILARTGKEALALLEGTPDVSVVITDLMMPEMSGFDLLTEMTSHLEWKKIPVIITSARAEPETVMKAGELGCRQFMVKPVHAADLIKAVNAAIASQPKLLRPRHEITERLGIEPETYNMLIERLRKMVEEVIGKLEQSVDAQGEADGSPVVKELPRLVEAAHLLGAESLATVVDRLVSEEALAEGEVDLSEVSQRRLLLRELRLLLSTIRCEAGGEARSRSMSTLSTSVASRPGERMHVRKRVVRVSY